MRQLRLFRSAAFCLLAIALTSTAAPARAADLSISGTFYNHQLQGVVGADLAAVLANNSGRWWTLTAYDVTYSKEFIPESGYYDYDGNYHSTLQSITRLHASSFDLEFFGPDAAILDAAVSQQLIAGSLTGGALLEMRNVYQYDEYPYYYYGYYYGSYYYETRYSTWDLGLEPLNPDAGVSFSSGDSFLSGGYYYYYSYYYAFPVDANGFPVIVPQRLYAEQTVVADERSGNSGALVSFNDVVDIGSDQPPLPPTLNILDRSVAEGQRGSTSLQLTVTLSRSTNNEVTVAYRTVNGTASASAKEKDYVAASGTLTIPANQLQGTITVQIKPDRKREPNETFTVQLSNPVAATISDGTATVTILNDD